LDDNFKRNNTSFGLTLEAYYKSLIDLIPYDIDNVRIRYAGKNNANGYAYGLETRIYGELVKDAESWLNFGLMRTRGNLFGVYFYQYKNAADEIINATSADKLPVDSVQNIKGWPGRPPID